MWTVIVGAAVLSAIPVVVGALEAPPGSPLRYRLFGTLGVHIGVLLVPAVFLVFSIPGRIRLTRARAETPGALYIVHSDLAEGGYEAIQVLGATPFRNYAVVNQTLCFAPEGLTVYRALGRRVFFLPAESIATVSLVRGTLGTGVSGWVFRVIALKDDTEHHLDFAFNDKNALFAFFPPPSRRKYAGILVEIRSALNIPTPDGTSRKEH